MRIITVKGFSKTGKTTTVTSLVAELRRRGYTVGTIKDIHFKGFEADTPGTDTYRHARAGARRVTARGLKNTALIMDEPMDIDEILKYYKEDFIIAEGDCGIKSPVIVTAETEADIERKISADTIAVSGIISQKTAASGILEYKGIPVINGVTEVEKLADLAEKVTEDKETKADVELTIGGEEIWMVPFVRETIKNVVTGAVRALDGYEEGKEIIIKIK